MEMMHSQLNGTRSLIIAVCLMLLSGCSSIGIKQTVDGAEPLDKAVVEIPEAELLDVWIELFEPGELPTG